MSECGHFADVGDSPNVRFAPNTGHRLKANLGGRKRKMPLAAPRFSRRMFWTNSEFAIAQETHVWSEPSALVDPAPDLKRIHASGLVILRPLEPGSQAA